MEHRQPDRSTEWRRIAVLIGIATVGRLILGAALGLGVDESYAVAVARPLSLSYYDHPPLVFWIAGLTGSLTHSALGVVLRAPFILLFATTSWVMYRLTTRFFGPRAGWYAVVALTITPVFSLSDGGWILPDGPLLLGMSLTVLCLSHAVHEGIGGQGSGVDDRSPIAEIDAWGWWIGAGASAGIAALSKYHAVFLLLGALLFLLTEPDARRWLARPQPWVAVLVAAGIAMPVFIWNAQHDWISLRFQLGRGGGNGGLHLGSLAQNIGGQALYLLPWTWLILIWQLWRALRAGPSDTKRWLLACFAIWPIGVFTLFALRSPGLPHWPAPGYLFVVPLLGDWLATREERVGAAAVRRWVIAACSVFGVLVLVAASEVATGWMNLAAPSLFTRGDPSLEAVDWSALKPELAGRGLLDSTVVIAGRNWITCAKIGFAIAPHPVHCWTDDPKHFQFTAPGVASGDSNVVVVERLDADQVPWAALPSAERLPPLTLLTVVPIQRGGRDAMRLAVYGGGER